MAIHRLLSTIESYLELKREVGEESLPEVSAAIDRVELAFREVCQLYFDRAIFEDRRRTSSVTTKVDVVHPDEAAYTWNDIVALLDALSNAPVPPKNIHDHEGLIHWMSVYSEWFKDKRKIAVKPVKQKLELDFEELKK